MIKAIFRDIILALAVIIAQASLNMVSQKPNDWGFIILSGILVGVVDFLVSFLKEKLESVNYKVSFPFKRKK